MPFASATNPLGLAQHKIKTNYISKPKFSSKVTSHCYLKLEAMKPISHSRIPGKVHKRWKKCVAQTINQQKRNAIVITIFSRCLEPSGEYHLHYKEHRTTLCQKEAD